MPCAERLEGEVMSGMISLIFHPVISAPSKACRSHFIEEETEAPGESPN